ncbi:hypothetical protein GHK92_05235 [Nocardioides sp. dk4132]|uniref:hypothetical protein n=1 Tax=unclassified Nocardioides TaxID=2615069 RepID=UPI001297A8CF|nr:MULTISPECIES: hypothetical protein [unclassified Nocardioides]MQW75271.1 hypothetical protein [Nocardioides sp. dk4132]QGA07578.1 hypothetical protein GFH29_09370 [Nocardioides sp. dk884]
MRRLLAAGLLAALLGGAGAVTPSGVAVAIPGGGAGADTPGTSASVSPRQVGAGGVLSFRVSGFPGGETLYVKIDDGQSCSAASVHGACVVHQQAIPASGSVSGSFTVPRDLAPGEHWLRFLASEEVTDATGGYAGTKGYTSRGASDFTVVATTSGAPTSAPGGTGTPADVAGDAVVPHAPASSAGTDGTTQGDAPVAAGDTLVIRLPRGATGPGSGAARPGAAGPADVAPDDVAPAADPAPAAAPTADDDPLLPVTGLLGLAVLLGAAGVLLLRGRRRSGA